METSLVKKWVQELRSGKYEQGHGVLKRERPDGTKYCCLGVLCELVGVEWSDSPDFLHAKAAVYNNDDSDIELPGRLMSHVGLDDDFMTELTMLNDGGELERDSVTTLYESHTFSQIADIIEERLLGEQ